MRADTMVARSTARSNQRPDTLMQDRKPTDRPSLLQRTAAPYIRGMSGRYPRRTLMARKRRFQTFALRRSSGKASPIAIIGLARKLRRARSEWRRIGRMNWLFSGSDVGGRCGAAMYSPIEAAKVRSRYLIGHRDG